MPRALQAAALPRVETRQLPAGRLSPRSASSKATYYFRRVMVVANGNVPGMAVWRERLFAAMHLNANLPAAFFGVPTAQVVGDAARTASLDGPAEHIVAHIPQFSATEDSPVEGDGFEPSVPR